MQRTYTNYVMCLKWGTKFSADYVNKLHSMVKRNLTVPFQFVCFTDDAAGLHHDIMTLPTDPNLEGWWGKMNYFKQLGFEGTALTLDLDVIIVDNIDCLFEHPGEFCIIKDHFPENGNNSSVMRFDLNKHNDLYDELELKEGEYCTGDGKTPVTRKRYWSDQVWITERRPDATLFPTEWVSSYKWECIDGDNFHVPEGTKIVLFTGKPSPHEALHHIGQWWK